MKKMLLAVAAAGALTALTATSAMAFENEFHGMFKFMGYYGNFLNGAGTYLGPDAKEGFFAEQRARLQYIAKANDNLKLVTHFELDSRYGGGNWMAKGSSTGYKGTTGDDGGNLDADQLTLETKNIYLDYNCPITGANVKVGAQPWADAYNSLFILADMTGAYVTKSFDPVTVSAGWFRFDDNTLGNTNEPGKHTSDLYVLDAKVAPNKNIKVGASYYYVQNSSDLGTAWTSATTYNSGPAFSNLNMVGANATLSFDPVTISPFAAYQFGNTDELIAAKHVQNDISAYLLGTTAKVKTGNGSINMAAIYMSGDDNGTGKSNSWQTISSAATYFNAGNMWLLARPGQATNTSTTIYGTDMTLGGRGLFLASLGYEGTVGKMFYNTNVGYAQTAEERAGEDGYIGCEINAQVGYKLYDNLSASVAGAYVALGDGMNSKSGHLINPAKPYGFADAKDPFLVNVQLSYAF